jgi:acyl carrier protein
METTEKVVFEAVTEVMFDGIKEEITRETKLSADLCMDSLDYVEVIMWIEEKIEKADYFPEEADEIPEDITVGQLIDKIDGWLIQIATETS